jgi:GT2 family glycosyltransferase
MRVLAAVVTHNRRVLLERCLDNIAAQTRPADDVLVIDNGSSDGTAEMLDARGVSRITQGNLGSAGGWNRAITAAIEGGYDAVWLMDDDGYPDLQALEILAEDVTPDVACISSVVLQENDNTRFVFPFPLLDASNLPVLLSRRRKLGTIAELEQLATDGRYPFAHLFNGALIVRRAIETIGNVDTAFFMFGDEVDYFFRLRSAGQVLSNVRARHYHPDVAGRSLTDAKFYYYIKNTLILNRRYMTRVTLRNFLTVGAALYRIASRNGVGHAASLIGGTRRGIFRQAIALGLRGQIGHDFDG